MITANNEEIAIFDLSVQKGVDLILPTYWTDSTDSLILGLNLWTGQLQFRKTIDSDVVLLNLTNANGGLVLGDTDGEVKIVITSAQTAAFDFNTAEYDILLTDPAGVVHLYLSGDVKVSRSVTRP